MSTAEEVPKAEGANQDQNDEWIVQSKPRRLVPQHSLSRQDLEADKSKVVVATAPDTKKKVIRFTKEEMMTFRQPAKLLSHMAEMVEVISTDRLNPVCFERFEPEDVIRIWNTEKNGPGGSKGADALGRGRGRGKPGFKAGEDSGETTEWNSNNPNQPQTRSNKGGLWDDAGASSANGGDGLDLEDFAAMALKFRSEMEQMKLSGEGGEGGAVEEDMMERLLREQNNRGGLEDEEEELPDWANDDDDVAPAPQPAAKRSLLLETLNVKQQQPAAQATVVAATATSSYTVGGGLNTGVTATVNSSSSSVLLATSAPPPLLRLESNEWLYTDPQGQVQGPFEQENMRQWNEAGYFSHDLPIKLRHWNSFHTFQTVFPDSKRAFLMFPQEPLSGSSLLLSLQQQQQAEAQRQAALRQQQILQAQQEEAQRKIEQERAERAALEAQQRQRQQMVEQEQMRQQQMLQQQQQQAQQIEAQRQAQLLAQQQQQAAAQQHAAQQAHIEHQRTLLEQQRQQAAAPSGPPAKAATAAPWANKQPGPNRAPTSQESLLAIQHEEKARVEAEQAARENERRRQAAEQSKMTPKGWTAPNGSNALSLAEIQQQEEEERRRQAEANKQTAAPATTSMSVQLKSLLGVKPAAAPANVSTGPAWGSGAAPAPASKSGSSLRDIMQEEEGGDGAASPVKGAASNAPRKPISWAAKASSSGVVAAAPAPAPVRVLAKPAAAPAPAAAAPTKAAPARAATSSAQKDTFGGKEMSKDMADWCAGQLKRLNGSEDLTLAQFCMSLESAAEIRQYLSEYLGSSPSVINFATDFIKYKEGGKKAMDAAAASAGGASGASSGNNNNPSSFVSANKKKKAPAGTK